MLQSSLASLKAETQQYTDQACDSVRNELLDKVQTLEGEVQDLREEVRTEKHGASWQQRARRNRRPHVFWRVKPPVWRTCWGLPGALGKNPRLGGLAASCQSR